MKSLWQRLLGRRPPPAAAPEPLPDDAAVAAAIAAIRQANLTYCGPPKLENVARAVLQVRRAGVPGDYLEAGVALGGSAILIGQLKPRAARLQLFDVFGMIPPPGPDDGEDAHRRYEEIRSGRSKGLGSDTYYGYQDDLQAVVQANLRRFGLEPTAHRIECVPGRFETTLPLPAPGLPPVAFAHVDCDWYESVRTCIDRIGPRLAPGAVIVFDDYSSYSGCRRAVDEWRARDAGLRVLFEQRSIGLVRG